MYLDPPLALELWDTLVAAPLLPSDRDQGFKFVLKGSGGMRSIVFLGSSALVALLEQRVMRLPVEQLDCTGWDTFCHLFTMVRILAV